MEYTKPQYSDDLFGGSQNMPSIQESLDSIRMELHIRNQIEWLNAMIEYSDDPEKYKKLLKSVYETR